MVSLHFDDCACIDCAPVNCGVVGHDSHPVAHLVIDANDGVGHNVPIQDTLCQTVIVMVWLIEFDLVAVIAVLQEQRVVIMIIDVSCALVNVINRQGNIVIITHHDGIAAECTRCCTYLNHIKHGLAAIGQQQFLVAAVERQIGGV